MEIIDIFPAFLEFWKKAHDQPLNVQIEGWSHDYLADHLELQAMQVENYARQNLDWKTIARERVFPFLNERLEAMQEAHKNLLELCPSIYAQARQVLGFESDTLFVIHVGIGCGAGWVIPYGGRPAILFGLENIAECGWSHAEAIQGLVAHEIGHVVHFHWRDLANKANGEDAWWQLYEEGFAQRCETIMQGTASWHQASTDDEWLTWCQHHRGWLADEFLKTVEAGKPVNRFFGSWYEIQGKSETGYFLGHEAIQALESEYNLKQIALLDDIETRFKAILEQMKNL